MKKNTFSFCFILMCFFGKVLAQSESTFSYGAKIGVSAANLYIDNYVEEKMSIGFQGGIVTCFPFGEGKFSVSPELLFTSKGSKSVYDHEVFGKGSVKFGLGYLELPVSVGYTFAQHFTVQAGPYAAFLLSSNIKAEGDLTKLTTNVDAKDLNRFDFGFQTDVNVRKGRWGGGFRYSQGLQKVARSEEAHLVLGCARNLVLQAYVAVFFTTLPKERKARLR